MSHSMDDNSGGAYIGGYSGDLSIGETNVEGILSNTTGNTIFVSIPYHSAVRLRKISYPEEPSENQLRNYVYDTLRHYCMLVTQKNMFVNAVRGDKVYSAGVVLGSTSYRGLVAMAAHSILSGPVISYVRNDDEVDVLSEQISGELYIRHFEDGFSIHKMGSAFPPVRYSPFKQ